MESGSQLNSDLAELFRLSGQNTVDGVAVPSVTITSLTDDSREVGVGSCFVAVRGVGRDGHDFADSAVAAGASVLIVDSDYRGAPAVPVVRVAETRVALARLAGAIYGFSSGSGNGICLLGVTGTNGKSTVVWLLRSILRAAGHPTALLGTIEYDLLSERSAADMTTPGPLELCRRLSTARKAGATHAVLEVSSHALDQHRCDGLSFSAGVFTNLTGDHLDYHKSMDAYGRAKRRLFDSLDSKAVAVINADDPMGTLMASTTDANVLTYGLEAPRADVWARIRSIGLRETRLTVHLRSMELELECKLIGRHNVLNVLAAAAASWGIGVGPDAIHRGIESVDGVPGRLQRAEPDGCPFSVLVDYAHTDDALKNVLQALRPLTEGRLICVFGCGGDRDRSKRPRMAAVVGALADWAIVTSDNPRTEAPRSIIDEIIPGFDRRGICRFEVEVDRRKAIESAIAMGEPGDTILIAGKGHENYQIVAGQVLPFDDLEVARHCLMAAAVA